MDKILRKMALEYHRAPKPGKLEVVPTKPYNSPGDLSLAYSPGVAYPCLELRMTHRRYMNTPTVAISWR